MINKLEKTDFQDKDFDHGRLRIKSTSNSMDIIIDKLNEIITKINKIERTMDDEYNHKLERNERHS